MVKPGDTVKPEQSLVTVESDKASMEIPSSHGGVLKELRVKLGDKVNEGSMLALVEASGGAEAAPSPQASPAPAAEGAKPAAAPAPAPTGGGGPVEVKVPDIGDFDSVAVIEVLIKAGDTIKAEQSLITVESDKASMEIPSSHAGVVKEVKVKVGDKVSQGSVVAVVEGAFGSLPHASPSVRRYARELGVPLDEMKGSGPKGRITQEDVQGFVKGVMAGTSQTRAAAA